MRRKRWQLPFEIRPTELTLLIFVTLIALLGFSMNELAFQLKVGAPPADAFPLILQLTLSFAIPVWIIHIALSVRQLKGEQLLWPILSLIVAIGLITLNRVAGTELTMDQIWRGYWPGVLLVLVLLIFPRLINQLMQNRWVVLMMTVGSLLLLAVTAIIAPADAATGAAINVPITTSIAIQTTEFVKIAIIFGMAFYLEWQGPRVEQVEYVWGIFAYPRLSYLIPGVVFVGLAAVLLFRMADLGALLVLGPLFIVLLYAGLQVRAFASIFGVGLVVVVALGTIALQLFTVPMRVLDRWLAFQNPWSHDLSPFWDAPIYLCSGVQIQQSIYGTIAGGLWGQGVGFGRPEFIPLALSDFILAAIAEEMGLVVIMALLALFLLLFWRILRVALLLDDSQIFERIICIGVCVHLALQLFFMAAGVWGMFMMTGIVTPFLSKGGVALALNLAEIGVILALALRLEGKHG